MWRRAKFTYGAIGIAPYEKFGYYALRGLCSHIMVSPAAVLSLGSADFKSTYIMHILNVLASRLGWSPIGKVILIQIDDAAEDVSETKLAGKLAAIHADGSAVIELDFPLIVNNMVITSIVAMPRHKNYNFNSLWSDFIAVSLMLPAKSHDSEHCFATATLKLR